MGLELKVEQKQRVYQKQIEQARILQMNAQELAVCIQEAALENPLIELEEMMDVPIEELVKKDVRETDETEAEVSEIPTGDIPAGISRQKTGGLHREENRKVLLI